MAHQEYQFAGVHFLASYLDCDNKALTNVEELRKAMKIAVEASGATILGSVDHVFDTSGYTGAIVLSESHATIHTYPEVNSCFVDIFTCGDKCSHERFDASMRQYLKPGKVSKEVILRNGKNIIVPST